MRPCLNLSILALIAATIAGCSVSSSTPGMGGIGGVNTPGAGTANPEATLDCRMNGTSSGDFVATDAVARVNPLGVQVEGKTTTYTNGRDILRNVIVDFYVVPVPGTTYTVGEFGTADTAIAYSEQVRGADTVAVWQASRGSVKVTGYANGMLQGTFQGTLAPLSNATSTISATGGHYSVKIIE